MGCTGYRVQDDLPDVNMSRDCCSLVEYRVSSQVGTSTSSSRVYRVTSHLRLLVPTYRRNSSVHRTDHLYCIRLVYLYYLRAVGRGRSPSYCIS